MPTITRAEARSRLPVVLGLRLPEAAAYIGVGVENFQRLVRTKVMPPPRSVGGVQTWDCDELTAAYKALPHIDIKWEEVTPPIKDTSWDDA
jgi:predicted DNA-binding transcriptional regulator AlpA